MFDSKETKNNAPVLHLELVEKRKSGFILDGTRGTKNEHEIDAPTAAWVPQVGFRLTKGTDEDGKPLFYNEEIRYIKHQREISVEEQKKKGIQPTPNKREDKIIIDKGFMTIKREGAYIGLYDYLKQSFYNESNPDRSEAATAIYREIDLESKAEQFNDNDIAMADAIQYVGRLVQKSGKEYKYNEEKINSICQLLQIYAETPASKLNMIMQRAKALPFEFMNLVMKFEQTIETEVTHALELKVVRFKGNIMEYSNKDKVIMDLGAGNLIHEKKIEKAASILGTTDYAAQLTELRTELEAAQNKALTGK